MLLLGSTPNLIFILQEEKPHPIFQLTLYGLQEKNWYHHWLLNLFFSMHVKGNGRKDTLVQAWIAIACRHG